MSISILLVPLAVAAAGAVTAATRGKGASGQIVCQVQTRMRDEQLLVSALEATGAVVTAGPAGLAAGWDQVRAAFQRDEHGVWSAHFTGADEDRALELVAAVDVAYGRAVQQAVLRRLLDRAPACGMRLESETTAADASVQLVFAVEGGAA